MKILFKHLLIMSLLFASIANAKDYNILDFGAKPNSNELNTLAIQSAINAAHNENNSRVIIPKGAFLTGSIILKSNVTLHLEKGAKLKGSTNVEDYSYLSNTTATFHWKSLILALSSDNIKITGKGEIDGNGSQLALNIDSLFYAGKLDSSLYQLKEKRPVAHSRPQLIQFVFCKNISIAGVTIKNSSSWTQTYDMCENLVIDNVKVVSVAYWNNDGIDIIDCKNVRITNTFVNASDDGICLKSYKRKGNIKAKCDSIYIGNCVVRSSASAIKLGTSSFGGFTNITIENIKVYDTYRSAIALESWETGILENILVQNITAINTGNALFIRLGKRDKYTSIQNGTLKNVTIRNVRASIPFIQPDYKYPLRGPALPFFHNVFPVSITGIPNAYVENVTLENITITYPGQGLESYAHAPIYRLSHIPENAGDYPEFSMFGELPAWGLYVRHVNGIIIRDLTLKIKDSDYRPAMVFDDVQDLLLESYRVKGDKKVKNVIIHPK